MLWRKDMSILPVTLAATPLRLFPLWNEPWEWWELVSVLTLDGKSAMVCLGIDVSEIVTPTTKSSVSPSKDSSEKVKLSCRTHWFHPENLQIRKRVHPEIKSQMRIEDTE